MSAAAVAPLPDEESKHKSLYGWGKFTPLWLQKLNCAQWLVAVLSTCAVAQGLIINSLVPISLNTLERRFHLNSVQSGLFASMYDISVLILVIPVTHFGGRGHKARWLGFGMLIMGLGSITCTIPQFISRPYAGYVKNDSHREMCTDEPKIAEKHFKSNWFYYLLLLMGQALHGVGATPLWTLGITFMDESVTAESSPLYMGIFFGTSIIGIVVGYVGGGAFLRICGDIGKIDVDTVPITYDDQNWYGAWWIGFLVAACVSFLAAFLMFGFPSKLAQSPQRDLTGDGSTSQLSFGSTRADFITGIRSVFRSTSFLFLCKVEILESILSTGVINFFNKILESFFRLTASEASVITGATIVPGALVGNILGGALMKKLKLVYPSMLIMALLADVCSLLFGMCFLLFCSQEKLAGVNVPYVGSRTLSFTPNLNEPCNSMCHCERSVWEPVCSKSDNHSLVYYSPCYAGCTQSIESDGRKTFGDCRCANASSDEQSWQPSDFEVKPGLCSGWCNLLIPFLVIFAFHVLSTFISIIPIQQAELRSVPFEQRSLAFGVRWIFIRLLGTIPGPVLFGRFVDSACLVWKIDQNGKRQDCPFYNNRDLSLFIVISGGLLKFCVLICLSVAYKFGRRSEKVSPYDPPDSKPQELKELSEKPQTAECGIQADFPSE